MNYILEWWKEGSLIITFLWAAISNIKLKKATADKEEALAAQEKIKIKQEDVILSQMIQETYQRLNKDVFLRLEGLEKSNIDLTNKYNDILIRNGILEEKSEAYEKKYEKLKTDYAKLKIDYDKVHKESKQLREEIDILKNNIT